jgi:hypothetical protein
MKVEVLYFAGCPNHNPTLELVRDVLREEGTRAEVVQVEVKDEATAQAMGFLGSPTIRINGRDVESAAPAAPAFGMSCRTYMDGGLRTGVPPREWIRAAVREERRSGQP